MKPNDLKLNIEHDLQKKIFSHVYQKKSARSVPAIKPIYLPLISHNRNVCKNTVKQTLQKTMYNHCKYNPKLDYIS